MNKLDLQPDLFPREKELAENIVNARKYFEKMTARQIVDETEKCPNCEMSMIGYCRNCGYKYDKITY